MGGVKDMMAQDEARRLAAIEIAVEAGALKRCEFHEDTLLDGGGDVEAAYRLGNSKFTAGEFKEFFETRREMTDTIKSVVDDNSADECYSCRKWEES